MIREILARHFQEAASGKLYQQRAACRVGGNP